MSNGNLFSNIWLQSSVGSYGTGSPYGTGGIKYVFGYKCELCGKEFKSDEIHTTLSLKGKEVYLCFDCSNKQMGNLITALEL
jgi:DNA-directed RNA polymerase subunit RPC12/RpoP